MATWFAQNSSVNIDSVNQWNSAANGSGSWLTWASLDPADILVANGKTSITINVNTACAQLTTLATGGTAGGGFILASGVTLTANCNAGGTTCVTFSAASPASASIIGACVGSLSVSVHGAVNSGTGTLNIVGSPQGDAGTGVSTSSSGVYNSSSGTVNITGNPKGGSGTFGQVSSGVANIGGGTVNITGNPVGGVYYGNNCGVYNASTGTVNITGNPRGRDVDVILVFSGITAGVYNASTGTVNVTGNVSGGAYGNSPGAVNAAGGLIVVNGTFTPTVYGAAVLNTTQSGRIVVNGNWLSLGTGHFAVGYGIVLIHPTSQLSIAFRVNSSGSPGAGRSLYTGGTNIGQPVIANVRSGTTFGASSEYTGTLAVPSPTLVAIGVSTDNTVGSYSPSVNASDIRTAVGLATANLDTQLSVIQSDTDNIQTRLPTALVSGRMDASVGAMAANTLTAAAISADAGAELAALVETYIVNEGDATAVMQAIADRIAADWVAGDASPLAVAAAVRTNLATELARIDAAISTRLAAAGYTAPATPTNVSDAQAAILAKLPAALESGRIAAALDSASINAVQSGLATTAEVAKIPKVGSTHRYTQVAADSGTKRTDVAITDTP